MIAKPIAMRTPLRSTRIPTALLCLFISFSTANAQNLVEVAFDAILSSSSELDEYRDIPINWKMKGRAQAAFNEGLDHLTKDDAQLALGYFNEAIAEDNSFWEVYYYRGVAYRKLEKFNDAKRDFRLLIESGKERYYSQIEMGKVALLQRDIDEADHCFNKAIRASDDNAYAHYMKGNNHMLRGLDKPAINEYRDCLRRDSTMYNALVRIAMITSSKRLADTFPYLDKVLRHDSLHVNALLLRGLARISDNQELAIRDFNNLLIKNPHLLIGRYLRGIMYSERNDFDRAFTDFLRLVEVTATDDNSYSGTQTWNDKKIDIQNLGVYTVSRVYGLPDADGTALKKAYCLLISGRAQECVKVVDALAIAGTEPLCVYFKAIAMEHTGQHSKAFELYSKALTLDKDIIDAYKKRGIYYQELKMWEKSIADFTMVLKYQPKTLIALKQRGVSFIEVKRIAEAVADFNTYLAIDSTNQEVRAFRGVAYLRQHDVLAANVDFALANRLDVIDSRELLLAVDSILAHGGDSLKVIASLNVITKHAPAFTDIFAHKFRLLIAMDKWDQVEHEIESAVANRSTSKKTAYSYLLTVKGMIKNRAKSYDEAVEILSDAIEIDKTNALAFLERGKLHARAGKSGKAIADLNKAMNLGRKDAGAVLASVKAGQ